MGTWSESFSRRVTAFRPARSSPESGRRLPVRSTPGAGRRPSPPFPPLALRWPKRLPSRPRRSAPRSTPTASSSPPEGWSVEESKRGKPWSGPSTRPRSGAASRSRTGSGRGRPRRADARRGEHRSCLRPIRPAGRRRTRSHRRTSAPRAAGIGGPRRDGDPSGGDREPFGARAHHRSAHGRRGDGTVWRSAPLSVRGATRDRSRPGCAESSRPPSPRSRRSASKSSACGSSSIRRAATTGLGSRFPGHRIHRRVGPDQNVLAVPSTALFRSGNRWAVFCRRQGSGAGAPGHAGTLRRGPNRHRVRTRRRRRGNRSTVRRDPRRRSDRPTGSSDGTPARSSSPE